MVLSTIAIVSGGIFSVPIEGESLIIWLQQSVAIAVISAVTLVPRTSKLVVRVLRVIMAVILSTAATAVWLSGDDRLRWKVLAICLSNMLLAYVCAAFFSKKKNVTSGATIYHQMLVVVLNSAGVQWTVLWATDSKIAAAIITATIGSVILLFGRKQRRVKTAAASLAAVVGAIGYALLPVAPMWAIVISVAQVGIFFLVVQAMTKKKKKQQPQQQLRVLEDEILLPPYDTSWMIPIMRWAKSTLTAEEKESESEQVQKGTPCFEVPIAPSNHQPIDPKKVKVVNQE